LSSNQVEDCLGPGKIYATAEECELGEFSGFGGPCAGIDCCSEDATG
jgi:hypothetical protein